MFQTIKQQRYYMASIKEKVTALGVGLVVLQYIGMVWHTVKLYTDKSIHNELGGGALLAVAVIGIGIVNIIVMIGTYSCLVKAARLSSSDALLWVLIAANSVPINLVLLWFVWSRYSLEIPFQCSFISYIVAALLGVWRAGISK